MQLTLDGDTRLVTRSLQEALTQIQYSNPDLFKAKDHDAILIEYLKQCEGITITKPSRSFDSILRGIREFYSNN